MDAHQYRNSVDNSSVNIHLTVIHCIPYNMLYLHVRHESVIFIITMPSIRVSIDASVFTIALHWSATWVLIYYLEMHFQYIAVRLINTLLVCGEVSLNKRALLG